MNRKNLNFKSAIFKIFFTYAAVYFFALIFKYTYDLESLFNNIQYKYLITLNIFSIFLGLPLSIIFDFILIKIFGLYYVLFFSPTLTILSVIQVFIFRKIKFKFSRNILFLKKPEKNNLYKFFENITFSHEPVNLKNNKTLNICGHYHPKIYLKNNGDKLSFRCFAMDKTKNTLFLPAFGELTGGYPCKKSFKKWAIVSEEEIIEIKP